ncbi:hypothetical protein PYCCODRAFT_1437541 [Trametes coccinea BRFM310]|uniref:Sodium/calcium exchanger membrane region domain-containing protein n=1 Tax=Trametes coccinea (strain BRFM310) TaxID=1353009 RepID=A0A1Y2IGV9_TRAC3|nr:hypothetical protein PYCCODRAFT_1437541 [Trametes coccinea BRFM310]
MAQAANQADSTRDIESGTGSATPVAETGAGDANRKLSWTRRSVLVLQPWWLSALLVFIPFAWASHWLVDTWGHEVEFVLCFIAIIPLQNIFELCGEQLAEHTGKDLGEFICITFKNCVEATLALILLRNCHLRLLQSTIVGVVVLHLLLVQGMTFLIGGSQTRKQTLNDHHVSVNPSLLMVGVLSIVVPTAFFASLDRGHDTSPLDSPMFSPLVGDLLRDSVLKMSRAIAIMLFCVYVASRIYRHVPWPPTVEWFSSLAHPSSLRTCLLATERPPNKVAGTSADSEQTQETPVAESAKVPLAALAVFIVVSIAVMCVTAEFLVERIDPVRERSGIPAEWFGLVLLPLVSFLPEAALAIISFIPTRKHKSDVPDTMARGTPIDLSIQFTLWWMPLVILVGWWTGKPIHLLFDYFEVALLLGTCILVNYVTADGETNFAEGFTMFTFYAMLATATWFYPGQPQVAFLLSCPGSVAEAVASGVEDTLALL